MIPLQHVLYLSNIKSFFPILVKQLITSPTRITCNTSSLIDHVLTNAVDKVSQIGVLDTGLSDHQLIFFTRKLNKIKTGTTKYLSFRSMKKIY